MSFELRSSESPAAGLLPALACALSFAAAGAALAGDADVQATAPVADVAAADAGNYDQQFRAAQELAWSGQREQAIAAYSALLARSPGNSDVLLGRGRVYAWMKRWAEAEADLRAATVSAPGYADAWSALGDMYLWSDRPSQAAAAYGRWLALEPADDPAPLLARGRALRAAGDLPAARADFEAAAARGADVRQVDDYLASLTPRGLNAGELGPEDVSAEGYKWSAGASAGWIGFSPPRAGWSDYSASVRRHFDNGSLAVEVLGINRFGFGDYAWALDSYVDVWHRGYAYLRYQQGPRQELFPSTGWWAELFQGAGQGWELSAGIAHLDFRSTVDLYSLGIGKYVGNWYLRLRHLYIPGDDYPSNSDRLLVRYYYRGDADNYIEWVGSLGRSEQPFAGTPGQSHTWYTGAALVRFPSPRWGFKIGAGVGTEDGGYDTQSVFGGLYLRW